MRVRDPLVDRREYPDERARTARAAGPDLAPDVAGLFQPDDPSPEGRGGKGTTALLSRELRLPALHVTDAGRNPLGSGADRSDDPGFDRDPERRSFVRSTTVAVREMTEELPPYEVDGPSGAPIVLYRAGHDAGNEPLGRGLTEGPLDAVGHDRAEDVVIIGS
jgi:hypothetical protein